MRKALLLWQRCNDIQNPPMMYNNINIIQDQDEEEQCKDVNGMGKVISTLGVWCGAVMVAYLIQDPTLQITAIIAAFFATALIWYKNG
jgi:hypothetical protein